MNRRAAILAALDVGELEGGDGRTTNVFDFRGPKAGETPALHGFRFMGRPDLQSLDAQWDHEPARGHPGRFGRRGTRGG